MRGVGARPRALLAAAMVVGLCGAAAPAVAQPQPTPPPPPPDTTTVQEPVPTPETAAPIPAPAPTPQPEQGPAHVPPDASGIDLSEMDTKDLRLLYFDPAQTYLTPYLGRAFTNALSFHKKKFDWKPWEAATILLKD